MAYLKFVLLALVSLPLLPLMYFQGKRIKRTVPDLPEAEESEGVIQKKGKPFHLLCMGESTIAGVGVKTHSEGFAGSLAEFLAENLEQTIDWKVVAKSGYTARKVHERLISKLGDSKPDLIAIGLGANDAFEFNFPWRFQKEMGILIEKLRSRFPETPIVFLNMAPIKDFPAFTSTIKFVIGNLIEIHGNFLKKEVAKHKNVFFNSEKITLKKWSKILPGNLKPTDFFSDGVHPAKVTYQAWGQETGRFVLKNKILKS